MNRRDLPTVTAIILGAGLMLTGTATYAHASPAVLAAFALALAGIGSLMVRAARRADR